MEKYPQYLRKLQAADVLHSCVQPAAMVFQGVFNFRRFGSELDGVLVRFIVVDILRRLLRNSSISWRSTRISARLIISVLITYWYFCRASIRLVCQCRMKNPEKQLPGG